MKVDGAAAAMPSTTLPGADSATTAGASAAGVNVLTGAATNSAVDAGTAKEPVSDPAVTAAGAVTVAGVHLLTGHSLICMMGRPSCALARFPVSAVPLVTFTSTRPCRGITAPEAAETAVSSQ